MAASTTSAFISYSREESEFALRLAGDLRKAGASVWLDQLDIAPGKPWDNAIEKALLDASTMLLILSPASVESENVRNEISFAIEEKKTILPILHRDCSVPLQLHRLQRVDFRTDYARGLNEVLLQLGIGPGETTAKAEVPSEAATLVQATEPVIARPEQSVPRAKTAVPATEGAVPAPVVRSGAKTRIGLLALAPVVLLAAVAGVWFFHREEDRRWAEGQAVPQIAQLLDARTPLAAFAVLERAEAYAPSNPALLQLAQKNSLHATIDSSPTGVSVWYQDYLAPGSEWQSLGTTPLREVHLPRGYFRWKIAKPGVGELVLGSDSDEQMNFDLGGMLHAPEGMVAISSRNSGDRVSNVGWTGGQLPAYDMDRYEVTNREYQKFVDSGGYDKPEYWTQKFIRDGREISFAEAMAMFRDVTGRHAPSTWTAGHYPEGQADFPVGGVSWYEASAYAVFAGKSLPVLSQWYAAAPSDSSAFIVPVSNLSGSGPAAVGTYKGVGPLGTYDMAGNVREWIANVIDGGLRPIVGGSWKSPNYEYYEPAAVPPFDRSEDNGFRCVRNLEPVPEPLASPIHTIARDFVHFKPASDETFQGYRALYEYPRTPLHQKSDGVVEETADWRVEKVEFDTGYRGERMAAYLFLPKHVKPPYQTVLFFPSARVLDTLSSDNGKGLGDRKFFDYVVQSGRAVMYPIYQDTYERRLKYQLPGGSQPLQLSSDWYKDAARSLDYLATRKDIDGDRISYLGVSMGSASGVIIATLLQDRLRTAVFLDGGYFLDPPPPGGDQADFAPRLRKPVLMVNGRYDFTFGVETAQNPLFNMLGTPAAEKRHIVMDTPHDVNEQRPQLMKAVLSWLDEYLGRVRD